jgi:heme exporter protein C
MKSPIFFVLLIITLGLLGWGTYQAIMVAPAEATMGDAQRIFYYHVPAATAASFLFWGNFLASVWYLWKRSPVADALAVAGAEVGVVFFGVVLISGPIWARYAWGTFWVWDARLTTSLVLWLLYVSYLVLRNSSEAGSTSVMAAALAVFAALDMPIVYMSNRWFRTSHPQPMIGTDKLNADMQHVLLWNMLAFCMFALLIAWFRYELERTSQKINTLHINRATRGGMAMIAAPLMLFFFDDKLLHEQAIQHRYMVIGYIGVWTIYIGYLLFLMSKLARLKKEEAMLGLGEGERYSQ